MTNTAPNADDPAHADRAFFSFLRDCDPVGLDSLLSHDFVIVDVFRGAEIPRDAFLSALGSGSLRFDSIDVVESSVRRYGDASIIVGRTAMRGHVGDAGWSVASRYTHVYVLRSGRWQLAAAQGTPIADTNELPH